MVSRTIQFQTLKTYRTRKSEKEVQEELKEELNVLITYWTFPDD
jgi:hypothetical protein